MKIIDADVLKKILRPRMDLMEQIPTKTWKQIWEEECEYLDSEPAVDAEPVRHGHWIPTEQTPDFEWECSECGNGFTNNKLSYCYDCGARMDEVVK